MPTSEVSAKASMTISPSASITPESQRHVGEAGEGEDQAAVEDGDSGAAKDRAEEGRERERGETSTSRRKANSRSQISETAAWTEVK